MYVFGVDLYCIAFADVHLSSYSKLLLASQEQVLGLLDEERLALQSQLSQEKEDPEACFIQSALLQLQVVNAFTLAYERSVQSAKML